MDIKTVYIGEAVPFTNPSTTHINVKYRVKSSISVTFSKKNSDIRLKIASVGHTHQVDLNKLTLF